MRRLKRRQLNVVIQCRKKKPKQNTFHYTWLSPGSSRHFFFSLLGWESELSLNRSEGCRFNHPILPWRSVLEQRSEPSELKSNSVLFIRSEKWIDLFLVAEDRRYYDFMCFTILWMKPLRKPPYSSQALIFLWLWTNCPFISRSEPNTRQRIITGVHLPQTASLHSPVKWCQMSDGSSCTWQGF